MPTLEDKIKITSSGCWEWTGYRTDKNYGRYAQEYVHRLFYRRYVGPIQNQWVLHKCDNPPCCNPKHLFLGNARDNAADRKIKGRNGSQRGTNNGRAKLNEVAVNVCRYLRNKGISIPKLASAYNVNVETIRQAVKMQRWIRG